MRDRLIELINSAKDKYPTAPLINGYKEDFCSFLADYLLDNGYVAPPCKVGDTVYYPVFGNNRVLLYKVISIKLNSKCWYVVCENHLSKSQMTHRAEQIGKTIFLTERQAEQALVEVANNGT